MKWPSKHWIRKHVVLVVIVVGFIVAYAYVGAWIEGIIIVVGGTYLAVKGVRYLLKK